MNLKGFLLSSPRLTKKLLALTCDFTSICLAILYALYTSELFEIVIIDKFFSLVWMPVLGVIVFWYSDVYKSIVRYIDFSVIFTLMKSITLTFFTYIILIVTYQYLISPSSFEIDNLLFSSKIWISGFMAASFFIIGSRLIANSYLSESSSEKKVVIYGAGSAGIQLARALRVSKEMQPVAFIDSNPSLHNTFLGGIKVLSPVRLKKLALRKKVDEVLIAMPSASKTTLLSLLKEIENYSVKVRILPGLAALAQGKVSVSELKEVDISDLLGRFEVEANQELINKNIKDRVVLITGAGGSIGSKLAKKVLKLSPSKLVLLDISENAIKLCKKISIKQRV